MNLLKDEDKKYITDEFKKLKDEVKIAFFTQKLECQFCDQTHKLLEEVTGLSDKLSLEVFNFAIDTAKVQEYKVDKIPATIIEGTKKYGIRFFGIPSGYEFTSLLEAISMVSLGDSGLSKDSRRKLKTVDKPVHIQVFITPTCPYCSRAVQLAHRLALESDLIVADMIEAIEFPHLSNRYQVQAVPKVDINERVQFEGALPESAFVDQVLAALEAE
jgi:glutaredoxin-like protein